MSVELRSLEQNAITPTVDTDSAAAPAPPRARPRMDFLDNIKVYLTFVVVLFHVICVCGPGCFHFTFTTVSPGAVWCAKQCAYSIRCQYGARDLPGDLCNLTAPASPGPFSLPDAGPTTVGAARRACLEAAGTVGHPFSNCVLSKEPGGARPLAEMVSNSFFQRVFSRWALQLNQSYFMAFFFFLSAYFTPTSLDRKGLHDFIADKVKRLGLPVLAWQCGLGQLMMFLSYVFAGIPDSYSWSFVPGPPWFIAWLLLFNLLYAFMAGEPAKVKRPQLTNLLGLSFIVGLVKASFGSDLVDAGLFAGPALWGMPGGLFSLVYYVATFCGGVIAKRGKWLDGLELAYSVTQVRLCHALSVFLRPPVWQLE